jgi:4-hydroxy-tetrahydrodipicolinate reductase
MSDIRLALIGMGKMGRILAELAPSSGFTLVSRLDERETAGGISREALNNAQVAIEFSVPAAAPRNIRDVVAAGCPIVVGTTGWQSEAAAVEAWVRDHKGALLAASNFSIGVNIFDQIVARAAELMASAPGFETHLVETHHSAKKDAPSGTAIMLQRSAEAGLGHAVGVSSVRVGSVPGTHEVIFDAHFEQIRLEHVARDRRVFAEGALVAARWLASVPRTGVFTMRDVLSSPPPTGSTERSS